MEFKKYYLKNNDCYKKATKITPKGIVVHSTGANNPNLRRYVQPDDGILGVNKNANDWNREGKLLVHAFIGKDKNGEVRCYQTLPFNYAAWGVGASKSKTKDPNRISYGKDKNGYYLYSYNYNPAYIQFEICEDNLKDEAYFNKAFDLAADFCAYLVKEYNISIDNVVSHQECYKRGYGSNHSDCDHWLKRFGKDMNWFRELVKTKMGVAPTPVITTTNYKVKIVADELNVRNGAGTKYKINTIVKKGEVFTIVEEKNGWGKLKSGAGWIALNYTKKIEEFPTKTVTTALNVRNKASILGKKIAVLNKGDKVKVYETKGSWSKIAKTSNKWCSSKYLK